MKSITSHRRAALYRISILAALAVITLGPRVQAQSSAAEPVIVPEALRANLSVKTVPISFVQEIPHASGLALIAAGSNADSRIVVSAPVDGTVGMALPDIGQPLSAGAPLATLDSPQLAELLASAQMAATRVQQAEQAVARDQKLLAEGLIATKRWQATSAELASARAADRAAQASLALARGAQTSHGTLLTLTAPTAGVLTRRLVQPGARVAQGTPLFELSTAGQWWLLSLPVEQIPAERSGVTLRIPGCADAPLKTVDATVDPDSQLLTLRAEPSAPCDALRPGQRVSATLWVPSATPTAAVPVNALSSDTGQWQVFVARAGQYFALPVTERASRTGVAYVTGAFEPGDALVISGANRLKAIRLGMGAEQ